jgi:hypothetical protein
LRKELLLLSIKVKIINLDNPAQLPLNQNQENQGITRSQEYSWGGKNHPVPASFQISGKCSVKDSFCLWACGNLSEGYPAYRTLEPEDVSEKKYRNLLSDMSSLMSIYENAAKNPSIATDEPLWPKDMNGEFKSSLGTEEALAVYNSVSDKVTIDEFTPKNRKRRPDSIAWTTVLKEHRFKKRTV